MELKCPQCVSEGRKSTLEINRVGVSYLQTIRDFIDEDGRWHMHDEKGKTNSFQCSNGHQGTITRYLVCLNPDCQYSRDRDTIQFQNANGPERD